MKIESSSIQLQAGHLFQQTHIEREKLTAWGKDGQRLEMSRYAEQRQNSFAHIQEQRQQIKSSIEQLSISSLAQKSAPQKALLKPEDEITDNETIGDAKMTMLRMMVEQFTGRKIELFNPNKLRGDISQSDAAAAPQPPRNGAADAPRDEGWGVVYDHYESYTEQESTRFQATGEVKTSDGQSIKINLELNLARSFTQESQVSVRAGDALKDPLVINFAGSAAELGERNFRFDIDADGNLEQIAMLRSGSGFLALDKNSDQKINNGSELFGPRSGNGFAELAAYDEDNNQWIDSNDSVYDRLRIWSVDGSGKQQLMGLGQQGIGAIYLGNIETPFLLKDNQNSTLGAVAASSIFLRENGTAGTVQHIDLAV
ncbi:MAG: hypothetical protein HQL49_04020 [Gammaproteobacteria bacterium]|nr:hypothetical protein [Gammaproteobacteria bacterium]